MGAVDSVLGVVRSYARVIEQAAAKLDKLGSDALGDVGRNVVELSRLQMTNENQHFQIGHRQAFAAEVAAALGFEPFLRPIRRSALRRGQSLKAIRSSSKQTFEIVRARRAGSPREPCKSK